MNGFNLKNAIIDVSLVKHGGPPKDGIPALNRPKMISAEAAGYLSAKDKVIGVVLNDEARAYPLRILNYHEIVNDVVGGSPIVISWCPLCGSALVFSAITGERILHFGVSGLLYNSDVLMYDKETNSLWSQLMMQAVSGPLQGERLHFLPSEVTTWADWRQRYPNTLVLSEETGYSRNYKVNPYAGYTLRPDLFAPVADTSDLLPEKKQVLGVAANGKYKAYNFTHLTRLAPNLTDSLAGVTYTIEFDPKTRNARISQSSAPLTYVTTYWFAWYAFHPDTELFEPNK